MLPLLGAWIRVIPLPQDPTAQVAVRLAYAASAGSPSCSEKHEPARDLHRPAADAPDKHEWSPTGLRKSQPGVGLGGTEGGACGAAGQDEGVYGEDSATQTPDRSDAEAADVTSAIL